MVSGPVWLLWPVEKHKNGIFILHKLILLTFTKLNTTPPLVFVLKFKVKCAFAKISLFSSARIGLNEQVGTENDKSLDGSIINYYINYYFTEIINN